MVMVMVKIAIFSVVVEMKLKMPVMSSVMGDGSKSSGNDGRGSGSRGSGSRGSESKGGDSLVTFATHATMTDTIPHMLSSTHMSSAKHMK
jgi:hypothetical protein